ncbi:hypothetical protein AAG570_009224 [Ranatra chinensis]|uniref:Multiple coagulation factor deficiency protein 2 homolog n=1 Tax=Ranatra chinensis TaxID=642074 RepID=A0ABD0YT42_9HEMI
MVTVVAVVVSGALEPGLALRGPHHPRDHHHHYSPDRYSPKITQDTQLLHDVKHIQEDLNNIVSSEITDKMTHEELEFHYFKLHDFDNNTKLDGLEILQAIRHTVEHEEYKLAKLNGPTEAPPSVENFNYLIDMILELIDQVLAEDDTDSDGYLSYIEYVIGRQKDIDKKSSLANR